MHSPLSYQHCGTHLGGIYSGGMGMRQVLLPDVYIQDERSFYKTYQSHLRPINMGPQHRLTWLQLSL